MLPSRDEAQRLWDSLRNCKVRYFKDHGHTLLLVGGIKNCHFTCNFALGIPRTLIFIRTYETEVHAHLVY